MRAGASDTTAKIKRPRTLNSTHSVGSPPVPQTVANATTAPAKPDTDIPSVVELFSGMGGLALGLARSGFQPWDMIEWSEACCATLRANASILRWDGAAEVEARDVRDIDFREYQGSEVVAAGAPCQPFSQGGGLLGREDERNMFPEAIRAIAQIQPRAFVIENVKGLLFQRAEDYFKSILARLRNPSHEDPDHDLTESYHLTAQSEGPDDEYVVSYALLNAADFGLAQNRPRLFIVGMRSGEAEWSWPDATHSRDALVKDLRDGPYWEQHTITDEVRERALAPLRYRSRPAEAPRWRTLRDLTTALGPPAKSIDDASDPSHLLVPGARLYAKHTGSRIDWVSKTVKAGVHGCPGGEHIVLLDDGSHRYLTVRECALLQGFPPDYVLPEKRTPAMQQLGNAVPVSVAEALGRQLRAVLGSDG